MDRTFEVLVARSPAEVFPWLYEPDKVPRWQSGVEHYELLGDGMVRSGLLIRETLEVSGRRRTFEMEVVHADPPIGARSRFVLEGITVETAYALVAEDEAVTRLRQTVRAKAHSLRARLVLPVVQPHLERKLEADLRRLRELLR